MNNKTVVITGGSSGIGKALAFEFAKNGFDLILVARNKDLLEKTKLELINVYKDIQVKNLIYDLSDLSQLKLLISDLEDLKFDYFFNNAGYGKESFFADAPDIYQLLNMIDLQIKTPTYLTYELIKLFKKRNRNLTIINVSSVAALGKIFPKFAVYAATKRYILNFTETVNFENEWIKSNVKVRLLVPGTIDTNFVNHLTVSDHENKNNPLFKKATNVNEFAKKVVNDVLNTDKKVIYCGKYTLLMRIGLKLFSEKFIYKFMLRTKRM